jgi:hypothetical protein
VGVSSATLAPKVGTSRTLVTIAICVLRAQSDTLSIEKFSLVKKEKAKGEIHETLQICKSLRKRQIQCFNNVSCHGFEFATPYRALPSFVNDPLSK